MPLFVWHLRAQKFGTGFYSLYFLLLVFVCTYWCLQCACPVGHKIFVVFSQQEEEGDDADISVTTSISSHSIPLPLPSSFPPLYGARYSETTANTATVATYGGLVAMEDSHDDDPESILDEHVQRVMKTPGCQSPGATNSTLGGGGRHSPPKSSRSPDGGIGPPHYPPHRGGGHSLPAAGVKGKRLWKGRGGWKVERLERLNTQTH